MADPSHVVLPNLIVLHHYQHFREFLHLDRGTRVEGIIGTTEISEGKGKEGGIGEGETEFGSAFWR